MYFGHWEIAVFVVPDINWVSPDSGDDLGITFYSVVFLFKEESAFRCRSSLSVYHSSLCDIRQCGERFVMLCLMLALNPHKIKSTLSFYSKKIFCFALSVVL